MKNVIRNERVQESIRRFRCRFSQSGRDKLFNVLPAQELARAVQEEVGVWRDRRYAPLAALRLFVEQVLHTDHVRQDVVVRYRGVQAEAKAAKRRLWTDSEPLPPWERRTTITQNGRQ